MNQNVFKQRIYITGLLLLSIACFFIFRIAHLHFSSKVSLPDADRRAVRRGDISDRNGYALALSVERQSLFANPEEIEDPAGTADAVARIVGLPRDYVKRLLVKKKRFVWIRRRLPALETEAVKKLGLKGLHFKKEFKRVYPQRDLASNVIGFVGVDNRGLEGLEYKYEDVLRGKKPGGYDDEYDIALGHHLTLTIDRYIQYIAQREIRESVEKSGAQQGIAVVYEIKTGRILALAKYPGFDPNRYWEYSARDRKNFSVVGAFEPGSTLKIIAVAALLEMNPQVLKKKFNCPGKITIADETIKCIGTHGDVDLDDIITHSCNVGIIKAMRSVKKGSFYEVLRRFGFGNSTGIELPGEASGILRDVSKWSGLSKYSISLGQEISVTSIQLVAAFGAIANGGIYMVPAIVESIKKHDGKVIKRFYPRSRGRILDKRIADRILNMMKTVVEKGTGKNARMAYYEAAGKTGTAQKSMKKGGYYSDRFYASFIGIAPYRNPDLCVLVMLDEPKKGTSGGVVSAPVFARIVGKVLPYRGMRYKTIEARRHLSSMLPITSPDGNIMPDFRGRTLYDALRTLAILQKNKNISYSLTGSGRVYKQHPVPGAVITSGQKVLLFLRDE